MKILFVLLTFALAAGSVGASPRLNARNPGVHLNLIVFLASEGRGLFLVQDEPAKRFGVAECPTREVDGEIEHSPDCSLVKEDWLPATDATEASFDRSLTEILGEQNTRLRERHAGQRALSNNLAIASLTGAGVAGSMQALGFRGAAFAPDYRILAAVVMADLATFGALEVWDRYQLKTHSLEAKLVEKGLRHNEAHAVSRSIYDLIREALIKSLDLPQTA